MADKKKKPRKRPREGSAYVRFTNMTKGTRFVVVVDHDHHHVGVMAIKSRKFVGLQVCKEHLPLFMLYDSGDEAIPAGEQLAEQHGYQFDGPDKLKFVGPK